MKPFADATPEEILACKDKVQLWGYRCFRCDHEWLPRDRGVEPQVCPKCKSAWWHTPKKDAKQRGAK